MISTLQQIFQKRSYIVLSIIISFLVVAFAVWLPNLHLITHTMTGSTMTIWEKTNLLASLLGSLQTNFTFLSRSVTIISATLAGIQVSLLMYYIRRSYAVQKEIGASFAGIVSSMLGVGCASCGSVILTTVIGTGSTTAVLGFLPFGGQEFGFIGIAIISLAIYYTLRKIQQPVVCDVPSQTRTSAATS